MSEGKLEYGRSLQREIYQSSSARSKREIGVARVYNLNLVLDLGIVVDSKSKRISVNPGSASSKYIFF